MDLQNKFRLEERLHLEILFLDKQLEASFNQRAQAVLSTDYVCFDEKACDPRLYKKFLELYTSELIEQNKEQLKALDLNSWQIEDHLQNNLGFVLSELISDLLKKFTADKNITPSELDNLLQLVEARNQTSQAEKEYFETRYRDFLISIASQNA